MDEKFTPDVTPETGTSASVGNPDPSAKRELALAGLAQEAQNHADALDLRERVRQLTARALDERSLSLTELRAVLTAITEGVGSGIGARGGDLKNGVSEAVRGMREALAESADALRHSAGEARSAGRQLRETEIAPALARLKALEGELATALSQSASRTGGLLREEFTRVADELRHQGSVTRQQLGASFAEVRQRVTSDGGEFVQVVRESAHVGKARLGQVASGVLAAVSETLKRQSDRLGH